VIVLAVGWYLRFGLSYRDVEELLVERGIQVDHVTIYRWVLRITPLLADAAKPCRHTVGDRWQTGTPTIASRLTTVVSRRGLVPCEDSSRTVAPG
jgi:transposase-like protein